MPAKKSSASSAEVNKKAIVIGSVLLVLAAVALWLNFANGDNSSGPPRELGADGSAEASSGQPDQPPKPGQVLPDDSGNAPQVVASSSGGSTGGQQPEGREPRKPPKGLTQEPVGMGD
ncbi:MAG TPA: hypothetical protein VGM03_08060 [Phycisphaerae bacterium]|jgi:hypothetical protein